ncbi:MAG: hypothetical protein NTZ93_01250 [Candidatus Beckwithbacteria bacterium]|nr:hypothetical protein [Candidatus Beckwithbacteria bacterium]
MLHSILITANNQSQILTLARQLSHDSLLPAPDTLIINSEPSIGIADIRHITHFLTRKPMFKTNNIVFISQAEKMTFEAQNAFLKTLEEPPAHSLIILATLQPDSLLETIISRCQIFHISPSDSLSSALQKSQADIFCQLKESSPGQKIALANQLAVSKQEALEFCYHQLLFLRDLMINQKQFYLHSFIRQITQNIVYLNQNVNPKLVLENLFLQPVM